MTDHSPALTIPQRPRLLPGLEVYERKPDEIQIGLEPRHAVVAKDLPPILVKVLQHLDGRRTTVDLLELAEGEHAERLRDLLEGLAERGLIEDAASPVRGVPSTEEPELWSIATGRYHRDTVAGRARSAVAIHGSGRLAIAVSTLLASSGVGHIDVHADGAVGIHDLGSGFLDGDVGLPRRQAVISAIQRANPATKTGRLRGSQRPDLVILTDAVVPAPELVRTLVADALPHLLARVRDGIGIVGPLVEPGRSACLRCTDLHRTSRDSCWPRVALQLAGQYQRAELNAVFATAGVAACQALRVLVREDEPPPTWNGAIEIDPYAGTTKHREWLPHQLCQCGAARPRS